MKMGHAIVIAGLMIVLSFNSCAAQSFSVRYGAPTGGNAISGESFSSQYQPDLDEESFDHQIGYVVLGLASVAIAVAAIAVPVWLVAR